MSSEIGDFPKVTPLVSREMIRTSISGQDFSPLRVAWAFPDPPARLRSKVIKQVVNWAWKLGSEVETEISAILAFAPSPLPSQSWYLQRKIFCNEGFGGWRVGMLVTHGACFSVYCLSRVSFMGAETSPVLFTKVFPISIIMPGMWQILHNMC